MTFLRLVALASLLMMQTACTAASPGNVGARISRPLPTIALANGTPAEARTRDVLLGLLRQPNVSRWIFTDQVIINEKTRIPHSHPTLTINTEHTDPMRLLSDYLHENLHWFLDERPAALRAAIEELTRLYPQVPVGGREGARSRESTYMHLINCWLEIEAVADVAGRAAATKVLDQLSRHHYTWIYERVREDNEAIRSIVEKHGLIPPARG